MSMTEAEARRVRPMMSGVIAMAVATVVAVGWYYLGRPDESTRPLSTLSTAEWGTWVKSGRADGKLVVLAPEAVPRGWRVRTAKYQTGVSPHWHLGTLTEGGKYVGLEESRDPTSDLVAQYVDEDAEQGEDVTVGGVTWEVWTDAGGDYALVRTLETPDGEQERILVVGSAPDDQVREFAASLSADAVPGA